MSSTPTSNPHQSEADDRFIEALLEEHARLGSGDDKALLALVRARTEEHPERGFAIPRLPLTPLQWTQIAAAVAITGFCIVMALQAFFPQTTTTKNPHTIVASRAPADPEDKLQKIPQRAAPPLRVSVAPDSSPNAPGIASLDSFALPESASENDLSPASFGPWQSPLVSPLSRVSLTAPTEGVELSIDEMQQLLATGQLLPTGAVSTSSLLRELPPTLTEPSNSTRLVADSASCPWENEHQLVHVALHSDGTKPIAGDANSSGGSSDSRELIVEFNPAQVSRYRLLGYAATGTATALYEIDPGERKGATPREASPPLKYQPADTSRELLNARFGSIETNVQQEQVTPWQKSSADIQVAAAASLFANALNDRSRPQPVELALIDELLTASASPAHERFRDLFHEWRSSIQ